MGKAGEDGSVRSPLLGAGWRGRAGRPLGCREGHAVFVYKRLYFRQRRAGPCMEWVIAKHPSFAQQNHFP